MYNINNHKYYYLSNGGGRKIYTLRHHQGGFEYNGRWIGEQDVHIQNLSRDYDIAVAKGKKIAENNNTRFESHPDTMNLNDYGVHFRGYNFDGKTMCYGFKYKGWLINNILQDEFGIKYLAEQYAFPNKPCEADIQCRDYIQSLPEIKSYHSAIEKEEQKYIQQYKATVKILSNSDWIGDIDYNIEIYVKIKDIFGFESNYGWTYCVKMFDMNNNCLIAFTSAKWIRNYSDEDFEKEITIQAIVKRHNFISIEKFDIPRNISDIEVKQTQLKRIKLIK